MVAWFLQLWLQSLSLLQCLEDRNTQKDQLNCTFGIFWLVSIEKYTLYSIYYHYFLCLITTLNFAVLSQLAAIILWLIQFYLKLQYNVLSREDKDNMWSSEGMTELGYSFW